MRATFRELHLLARVPGVKPSPTGLESAMQPSTPHPYQKMVRRGGLEPPQSEDNWFTASHNCRSVTDALSGRISVFKNQGKAQLANPLVDSPGSFDL